MHSIFHTIRDSIRDLLPIILVILFFQLLVLGKPLPNWEKMVVGTLLVIAGLTFFIRGLEMGLFPIGESMAYGFARKGSVFWLVLFAFALGFGATVAEPALIAVAAEAANAAAEGGIVADSDRARANYAIGLSTLR